jgi:3'-5' exoribonuclease
VSTPGSVRASGPPRTPGAFCGSAEWPLIAELVDGSEVAACYLVREKKLLETKAGKKYLKLTLADRTGQIPAMVWDDAERWDARCPPDAVVGVRARVGLYQDQLQLVVTAVEPLDPATEDFERLLPASPRARSAMERELDALVASVEDPALRALLRRCTGRGHELGRLYRSHPAAMRNHHAYLGGLLEHSLSVAGACDRLVAHYATQGLPLDRDLLMTAALLHDIGKISELMALPASGYTDAGRLLGHIVIGVQLVSDEGSRVEDLSPERLLHLQHLILSHQGKPEWDSPRVPQTVEALVLHYADDLDAKLNQVRSLLERVPAGEWSQYDRGLERSFFRPPAPPGAGGEPGGPDEALELPMDLFRA